MTVAPARAANNSGLSMSAAQKTKSAWRTLAALENVLLHWIFRKLLKSENCAVTLEGLEPVPLGNLNAIRLRLPNLYDTMKILIRPDVMLGDAYVKGAWAVAPEKLYDFLYLIRSQEESKLQSWFLLFSKFHLFRDALQQRF